MFVNYFNWLKYTLITPSKQFKNRLLIERSQQLSRVRSTNGNIFKTSNWLLHSSKNLKNKNKPTCNKYLTGILNLIVIVLLLLIFKFYNYTDASDYIKYLILRILELIFIFILELTTFLIVYIVVSLVSILPEAATAILARTFKSYLSQLNDRVPTTSDFKINRSCNVLVKPGQQSSVPCINLPNAFNLISLTDTTLRYTPCSNFNRYRRKTNPLTFNYSNYFFKKNTRLIFINNRVDSTYVSTSNSNSFNFKILDFIKLLRWVNISIYSNTSSLKSSRLHILTNELKAYSYNWALKKDNITNYYQTPLNLFINRSYLADCTYFCYNPTSLMLVTNSWITNCLNWLSMETYPVPLYIRKIYFSFTKPNRPVTRTRFL